jgi:hypothetical protein
LRFRARVGETVATAQIIGLGRPSFVELVRDAWHKIGIHLTQVF